VTVGCKIYIRRPGANGELEERLAEILSIRDKPTNPYARRTKPEEEALTKPEDRLEYFVHWDAFNKRLDDWVSGSRLVLSRDLEWPRPKAPVAKKGTPSKQPGKAPRSQNLLKKATSNAALAMSPTPAPSTPMLVDDYSGSPSPAPSSLKRKTLHDDEEEEEEEEEEEDAEGEDAEGDDVDAEGEMDVDGEGEVETFDLSMTEPMNEHPPLSSFSKEKEIEKLRTSGSMTQSISEIARVKNLNRLQIGRHELDAWYFSPYPKEYAHLPVLYICEFCLAFFPSPMMFSRHRQRCTMLHPPGNEIYRHEDISFYEIDGKRQLTWCRNLSLLSKCFLDQCVNCCFHRVTYN
jgi:histone acetyltransferase HTATIP